MYMCTCTCTLLCNSVRIPVVCAIIAGLCTEDLHACVTILLYIVLFFSQVELKEVELAHQEAVKALKLVTQICFSYTYGLPYILTIITLWKFAFCSIHYICLKEHDQAITKAREDFERLATGGCPSVC